MELMNNETQPIILGELVVHYLLWRKHRVKLFVELFVKPKREMAMNENDNKWNIIS